MYKCCPENLEADIVLGLSAIGGSRLVYYLSVYVQFGLCCTLCFKKKFTPMTFTITM